MKTNLRELSSLVRELSNLSNQKHFTKQDEQRMTNLHVLIGAVKAGASLEEANQEILNEAEARHGFVPTKLFTTSTETRAKAAFMQQLSRVKDSREIEFRANEAEGNLLNMIGTYSGLGYFVPTDFYGKVYSTMAAHDPLFDDDACTVIKTDNANPILIGTYDDIENVAVQVGEAGDTTGDQVNLGQPGGVKLGAYSYRTPVHKISLETFQDLADSARAYDLFARFAGDRMARGIGAKLINGSGSSTTLGLAASLLASGVSPIVASGSSANTGGVETGRNTIGSADLADLYFSVNSAYRASEKCAWLMNDNTLQYLCAIVTKQGLPLVKLEDGLPTIMGKPVRVSPSMSNMGSDAMAVIFGDLSYWNTRIVTDSLTRVRVLKESVGLVENGLIGLQMFVRADGVLAYSSSTPTTCPLNYIQNHS
jgi:HK97 family phage major capsid protein